MKEVVLDAGSKEVWIFFVLMRHSILYGMLIFASHLAIRILSGYGVNAIYLKYALYLALCLVVPATAATVAEIWQRDFSITDDCTFYDVDLYTVTKIRYWKHSIWLDKARIDGVPNPKKLLNSLDDYFYQITGGNLP